MDKPIRKQNRLKNYDYNNYGSYFITICTKDKKSLFCHYVGNGILNQPTPFFSEYGNRIKSIIQSMSDVQQKKYAIDKYVIMPNHLHFIISITDAFSSSSPYNAIIPSFVSTLKRFSNKECGIDL